MVDEVSSADSYIWQLDPTDAGTITEDGNECSIDWTDYWEGEVNLSVKSVNDCGESDFSENLQIFVTLSDIDEQGVGKINVFPNPNKGEFVLNFSDQSEKVDLIVLDNVGRIVFESFDMQVYNHNMKVNLDNIFPGIYFIVVKTNNNTLKEKIIIK